jgi:SAM-dependent methyltransferase
MSAIPDAARSILSIGCGSGATEAWLAKNGRRVVAVPLDPVISSSSKVEDVQLVLGTMKAARERLEGESFDCLLLSNALQFVKDPVQTLSSFVSLLRGGSVAVAVVPNFGGIPRLVKRVLGDRSQRGLADYASTGVHPSSRQVIRKWFRDAGLTNDKVINVLAGRAEMVSRLTLGLADGVLASELVAVARKN